ncbi:hypothetical protein [Streptomyces wuyuanensis]|uniref:hypothetical protein n=1 Tax=Streptomyces wuyuanensis TaxID=1196353 RepID=UPI003D737C56
MTFGVPAFITDQGIRPAPLGSVREERAFGSLFIAEHSHVPASRRTPCHLPTLPEGETVAHLDRPARVASGFR